MAVISNLLVMSYIRKVRAARGEHALCVVD